MNKFFTRIVGAALGLAMAIGVGVGLTSARKEGPSLNAAVTSYTISFTTGSDDGTEAIANSTPMSSFTSSAYVTGKATTATKAYYAGSGGLKLGTSKAGGSLGFSLSASGQVTATKVTVNAKRYNDTKAATIKLGNLATQDLTASFTEYEFSLTGALTSLTITTSKYAWVASVSVYYNAATPATSVTVTGNDGSSLAPGQTRQLGATVLPSDHTDTITWSSSNSNIASVSSTGLVTAVADGSVTITARANANVAGTTTISVETPTTPAISLSTSSISSYTGAAFSIVATYSNLTSSFGWGTPAGSGSISGSITAETGGVPVDGKFSGTSTYSGTLTGEGSVSLSTSGGGVDNPPSVSFTITQTVVNIIKGSTSIVQGGSETLEVTHNASSIDGLTWTSNNSDVEVDSDGKVTVASNAEVNSTAIITATSKVDTSISDTCTVTVLEKISYNLVTSAPNDWRGTYLIVNTSNNTAFDGSRDNPGSGTNNKAVTISGSSIDKTNTTESYVVKIERNLTDSSKYSIKTNSGLYIGRTEGTSGGDLETTTSAADAPANDISFSNDVFTITCGTYHLRYNSNGYFRYYTSASQQPIQLYKLHDSAIDTEVSTFVTSFYSATDSICENYDTNTASSFTAAWGNSTSGLTKAFNDLSVDAQGVFANTTYTVGKETKGTTEDLADRYDYIISKYSTLSDFMGRKVSNTYENNYHSIRINVFGNSSNESITSIIVIIVVGFAALIAVSGFLYISKRKQR